MDFADEPPHLLDNKAIVWVALRQGAEFTHMKSLAQVEFHIPPNPIGKRHDVLSLGRKIREDSLVHRGRPFHALHKWCLEPSLLDLRRRVIAVHGGEILALLGEYSMPLEVTVDSQITNDIERIICMLKCPTGFVTAVPALSDVGVENLCPLLSRKFFHQSAHLTERQAHIRVENGRQDAILSVPVVIDETDRPQLIERSVRLGVSATMPGYPPLFVLSIR